MILRSCGKRFRSPLARSAHSPPPRPLPQPLARNGAVLLPLPSRLLPLPAARRPASSADPADRLRAVLAGRDMVLVLDNCEHVIDAAAGLAARILADYPGIRVLATSRESLRIPGDAAFDAAYQSSRELTHATAVTLAREFLAATRTAGDLSEAADR